MTDKNIGLHYFRIPRHLWELQLTRMKQLGAETIYTPLPWGFHEFAVGKFDFHGLTNPRRNLIAFVDLCAALNLRLVLDLSPLPPPEAALLNNGLPVWLLSGHPEIKAKRRDGTPLNRPSIRNTAFIRLVERWYQAVGQALASKSVAVQLTVDEIELDYSDQVARVQWPVWLRKRYAEGGIQSLNAAYAPPVPYSGFGKVELSGVPDSEAFRLDAAEFTTYVHQQVRQTYTDLLRQQNLPIIEPMAPPIHGVQINPDFADVGATFQWAMDAPVCADGSPGYEFRQRKAAWLPESTGNLQILYTSHPEAESIKVEAGKPAFRLLLNGKPEAISLKTRGQTARLNYVSATDTGDTDFYLLLPKADSPLTGAVAGYLASLLAAQTQAVRHAMLVLQRLNTALLPQSVSQGNVPAPPTPALSEAQAALTEANQALHKAAASIGALEDVFATALNKPQHLEAPLPFLALDPAKLGPVRDACLTALGLLQSVADTACVPPFTLADYTAGWSTLTDTAARTIGVLADILRWLREGLTTGDLPSAAWNVHAQVESVLQTLSAGVLRQ